LLRCFANCENAAIVAALGLQMRDLFERGSGPSRVTARYTYSDAEGDPLYEVVRQVPKAFKQRRPDGRGGWRWGLNGLAPVLYRLPEVLRAVEAGETVYIVEGERDSDRLAGMGLTATTNPMGAGKWRDAYSKTLRGARVVILPDNDEPGREHAKQVARSLLHIAKSVKVVELPGLPEKGDVADWLDSGGSVEDLHRLAREASEQVPYTKTTVAPEVFTATELMAEDLGPVKWAVPGILPEGVTLLAGRPKFGKSWLGLGLCVAVATGSVALGSTKVERGEVLYLALEDNRRRLQNRLGLLLAGDAVPEGFHIAVDWPRADDGGVEALDKWLSLHPSCRLCVIDTLARFKPRSNGRRTQYDEDRDAVDPLASVANDHNVALLLIHHLREAESEDPLDMIHGSAGLTGGVDGALVLKRKRGNADAYLHVDGRDIENPTELALEFDTRAARWMVVGDAAEYRTSEIRRRILRVLEEADGGPIGPQDVADILDMKNGVVRQRLHQMSKSGEVKVVSRGLYIANNHSATRNLHNGRNKGSVNVMEVMEVTGNTDNVPPDDSPGWLLEDGNGEEDSRDEPHHHDDDGGVHPSK
jgi:AAA domain